jgi:2-keto-4-pentenoate hydratase/2-oxohepta-3-ene-1,7-dioic acid hydratase in catechol pathway
MNDQKLVGRFLGPNGRPSLGWKEGDFIQPAIGDLFAELIPDGALIPLSKVRMYPPIRPSKIIGIGSNYRKHIEEMGRAIPTVPKLFLKPSSAVIGPRDPILIPPVTQRVDHEAELAVVIGRHCSRVSASDAMKHVVGFTCVNDVTARDFQKQDGVFSRAKGFDSFCPMGPWILRSQNDQPRQVICRVDGVVRQNGNSSDLLFSIPQLISFVSSVMTLFPGDVITTGTPSGVSPLKAGQVVEVEVEGIGVLRNPVIDRDDRHV